MSSSKRDAACRALNDKAHLQSYTAHPELNICSCKPDLHGMPFEHCQRHRLRRGTDCCAQNLKGSQTHTIQIEWETQG